MKKGIKTLKIIKKKKKNLRQPSVSDTETHWFMNEKTRLISTYFLNPKRVIDT